MKTGVTQIMSKLIVSRNTITSIMLVLIAMATLPTITQASSENILKKKAGLAVEPAGAFEIPPEVRATMSKEELYALQAIPGYFTPEQMSVQQVSGQQVLLANPQPVKAVVIVDEDMREELSKRLMWYPRLVPWEMVYDWANNILEGGDDGIEIPFGIDTRSYIYTNWDSPDNLDMYGLLYAIDDVDPTGVGCDILVLMTGQNPTESVVGLAWILGRHFVMKCTVGLPANLFQHEATHLFGPNDHGWDWGIFCIMSCPYMFWTRGYCSPCTTNINEHRFRFD